jgi:hypothetical protein
MPQKKSNKILSLLFALIALGLIYSLYWYATAQIVQKQIDKIWTEQFATDFSIVGEKPSLSGFPLRPTWSFSGSLQDTSKLNWEIKDMHLKGVPLPAHHVTLESQQGLQISNAFMPRPIPIDQLRLDLDFPSNFPLHMTLQTMSAWRDKGGQIAIPNLVILSSSLTLAGNGFLELDQNLQPSGRINLKVTGFEDLLTRLEQDGIMKGPSVKITRSFAQMMTKTDPETNTRFIMTELRIQDQGIFLGPMRIGTIQKINWQ